MNDKIEIFDIYTNSTSININFFEFELTMRLSSGTYDGVRPVINP